MCASVREHLNSASPGHNTALGRLVWHRYVWLLIAGFAQASVAQEPDLFRTTPVFAVGAGPTAVVTCDLNEDGLPDVVTADQSFDDVAVLLADGQGGFLPQIRFGVGRTPLGLACADLDNDGHLDVVTANNAVDSLSILRGNGNGTFAVGALTVPVQDRPLSVAIGHLNSDEFLDIAVGATSGIKVFLGSGGFAFAETSPISFGGAALAIADLDDDGASDVIAASSSTDRVQVFWGVGDGPFAPIGPSMVVGDFPSSVAVDDVNEDGIADILVSNKGTTDDVSILIGLAIARQFAPAVSFPVGTDPTSVLTGDVDKDGHVDIITANEASNDVTVRLGRGDGTFNPEIRFGAGNNPRGLAIANYDGDNNLDIVTPNFVSNDVSLLIGDGDGTFRWEPRFGVGGSPSSVAACDVNNDGVVDLASANTSTNDVSVLIGRGDGSYNPEVRFPTAEGPVAIECVDVTGNGNLDIVVANQSSAEVSILLGNGDGTFSAKPRFSVGLNPNKVTTCDLDEDGELDIVTSNLSSEISILFAVGGGFFLPEVRLGANTRSAREVNCADMNNDGHADLVYALGNIVVMRGNGDGSFEIPFSIGPGLSTVTDLVVAHIDGDNNFDVVATSSNGSRWSALRGNGDGTLSLLGTHSAGSSAISLAVADVDLDGKPDVIVTNQSDDDISVFLGNGNGTFMDQIRFGVGEDPRAIAAADVDGDKDDDLIIANSTSRSLSVLFNTAVERPISPNDTDGDGVLDVDDNCPERANPGQDDFDGDGMGDVCDSDIDNDGVLNGPDVCDQTPSQATVQPNGSLLTDADGDCDVDLIDFSILQREFSGPG